VAFAEAFHTNQITSKKDQLFSFWEESSLKITREISFIL
jgi:hypothetical protein